MKNSLLCYFKHRWKFIKNDYINGGMGGEEECHLYQCKGCQVYKCVTKDRYGNFTWATYHENWD